MKRFITICVITLLMVSSADADITTYFGQDLSSTGDALTSWPEALAASNNFQSMLVGVGTEDFELLSNGLNGKTISFGTSGTATFVGDMSIEGGLAQLGAGRYPTSGLNYVEGSTGTFTIDFTGQPVAAFGFYGIDLGDFLGQATVTTVNGGTETYNIEHALGSSANASVLFWGIIDTTSQFTQITIANSGAGTDYFGFDDMTIGTIENVVPVPGAFLLGMLGLSVAGVKLRKHA